MLGKKIQPIIEDGASDPATFAEKAKRLLEKDQVAAVVGCYTSAARKAVLPVFEKLNGLLYYPTYYEGLERSPNIIYTGQEATQSSIAATEWLHKNRGSSFYFVGSDYIWPRTTIKLCKSTLRRLHAEVVGENNNTSTYTGLTSNTFKQRFYGHRHSFKNQNSEHSTTLSS